MLKLDPLEYLDKQIPFDFLIMSKGHKTGLQKHYQAFFLRLSKIKGIEQIKNDSAQTEHSPIQTQLYRFKDGQSTEDLTTADYYDEQNTDAAGMPALKSAENLASVLTSRHMSSDEGSIKVEQDDMEPLNNLDI